MIGRHRRGNGTEAEVGDVRATDDDSRDRVIVLTLIRLLSALTFRCSDDDRMGELPSSGPSLAASVLTPPAIRRVASTRSVNFRMIERTPYFAAPQPAANLRSSRPYWTHCR
jgi:hypothetical protein